MDLVESNKMSIEEALEQACAWQEKGATLQLTISIEPDRRAVCEKLAGRLSYVDDGGASLAFVWRIIEPEPRTSGMTFVDGEGRFIIRLGGASFSVISTPQKSMTISRDSYQCVLTEIRASAFG